MSLPALCHGIIAGLVMVASGSPVIEPYAAVIAGIIGAAIYVFGDRWLLVALRVDDATGAIATQVSEAAAARRTYELTSSCGWLGLCSTCEC
jgi:ammonia channel protein AmtB